MWDSNARHCPSCGHEERVPGTLRRCESCHSLYCGACTSDYGGGCPYCGSHDWKQV